MKRLAAFAVSGYSPSILCAVGFALSALFIPVGTIFSAAVLGLVGLQFGWQRMFLVGTLSAVSLIVIFMLVSGLAEIQINLAAEIFIVLIHWLPVMILTQTLRSTGSLSYTIQRLVFFMVLIVLSSFWIFPDSADLWDQLFNWISQGRLVQIIENDPAMTEQYYAALTIMTGIIATATSLLWLVSLLLARWWQSLLIEPGSFVREFTELQLGKVVAGCGLFFFGITFFAQSPVIIEVIAVLMAIFMIQGIATVHFLLSRIETGRIFLFIFYGALIISVRVPILPGLIAVLGMMENFVGLRKRMITNS